MLIIGGVIRSVSTVKQGIKFAVQKYGYSVMCREIIAVCSQMHAKYINTAVWAERRIAEC